jgi:flagellar export protein FliJ
MAEFRYRLQPLLDKKIALKDEAQRALAERIKQQKAAEEQLKQLEQREADLAKEHQDLRRGILSGGPQAMLDPHEIESRSRYLEVHETELEAARDAVFSQKIALEDAVDAVGAARTHLGEASREVEVLNKHREKSRARFMKEAERKEAIEQDEIGAMLHGARKNV